MTPGCSIRNVKLAACLISVKAATEKLRQTPLQPSPVVTPLLAALGTLSLSGVTGVCRAVAIPTKLRLKMAAILFLIHRATLALAFNQSSAVLRIKTVLLRYAHKRSQFVSLLR
jgi:hypothetical protein